MSVVDTLFAALRADPTLSSLVGSRIYPNKMPQGPRPDDFTAIVVQVISDVPQNAVTGTAVSRLRSVRVQVDCWSKHYDDGQAIADAVDAVATAPAGLNGWTESRRDLYDDEAELHRVMMDLDLWV